MIHGPHFPMKTPQKISLVSQTADILRHHIATGKVLHTLPGENKLAEDLQVSRKTLRAALQILTAEKIISTPKAGARRSILKEPDKKSVRKKSVGVMLPRPLDELHASSQDLFRALRKHMDTREVGLHFHDCSFHTPRQNAKQAEDIFTTHHADVWLVLETTRTICEIAQSLDIPTVACGGVTTPDIHNVAYDVISAMQHACHKLINAGHTRICYPIDHSGGPPDAFLEILEKHSIPRNDSLHFPVFDNTTAGFVSMLERLFRMNQRPTAFITGGPRNLITLMTWLAKHKLSVPDDISILHIGSDPMLDPIIPQISYYSTSFTPLARELDRVIGSLLESGKINSENKKFFMDYIPGKSIASPPE